MVTKLIQPCCAQKQLRELRNILEKEGTAQMEGYDDLSLTELLPALLIRYSNAELLIAAPSLPDQAAEIIATWMRKQYARMDGCGNVNAIAHLTIVSDLSEAASPDASAWLKDNPYGERLTLHDIRQDATAILLQDFAIEGPVNMRYGKHFTATAYGKHEDVEGLWTKYKGMAENAPEEKGRDVSETVEPEKSNQSAGEAADTVAEDAIDAQPAVSPMARQRGRRGRRFY